jgi:hypothetical protein
MDRGGRRVFDSLHSTKIQIATTAIDVTLQMDISKRRNEDSIDIRLLEAWRFHVFVDRALFIRASYNARFRTRGDDGLSYVGTKSYIIGGETKR